MPIAPPMRMTTISLWSCGARECLAVGGDRDVEVLLVQRDEILRRTTPMSPARAFQLSDAWRRGLNWDDEVQRRPSPQSWAA